MFENCLYFNLNDFTRKINKVWMNAYQSLNLSPAHAYVLRMILFQKGLTIKQLAQKLNVKQSTMTRNIDSLVANELVERRRSKLDKRRICIYPTPKSIKLKDSLEYVSTQLYKKMRNSLGNHQVDNLISALKCSKNKLDLLKTN